MRELQTPDVFALVRIITKAGIKEELKGKILEIDNLKDVNAEAFGYDVLLLMIEKAAEPQIENEIYKFFSEIFEESVEDIKKSDPIDFFEKVMQVATPERWLAFFESAARLMKRK